MPFHVPASPLVYTVRASTRSCLGIPGKSSDSRHHECTSISVHTVVRSFRRMRGGNG
jgi:hypothetical protein